MKKPTSKGQLKDGLDFQYPLYLLVFEVHPTDKDDMSLSCQPGLILEQASQLMITPLMFDKLSLED